MRGNAVRRFVRITIFILIASSPLSARLFADNTLLRTGIAELSNGKAEQASETFQAILEDISLSPFHADALYWLVKSEMLLKRYESAGKLVDDFFAFHPNDGRIPEMMYQQARLLYLRGDPEKAIIALHNFTVRHPRSPFIASTQYWIGESLMALGRLEEAERVFKDLINTFPSSVKHEAARYRISEIAFLHRERTLLELLRWTHEEYLQSAEDLQRVKIEYFDAIKASHAANAADAESEKKLLLLERLFKEKEVLFNLREFYSGELLDFGDEN